MKKSHFNIQRETKALAHTGEMELFYREEIEDCYQLFIKTIFPYFKEFVDGRY